MNKEYTKALSIVENTLKDINRVYDKAEYKEFEDIKAYQAMENLIEHLEIFIREIKHYSKAAMDGNLILNTNKRYSINNIELTCGQPIEAYNPQYGQWEAGRVEHSNKYDGYYFYNYDDRHKALFDGMRVRIRVKDSK